MLTNEPFLPLNATSPIHMQETEMFACHYFSSTQGNVIQSKINFFDTIINSSIIHRNGNSRAYRNVTLCRWLFDEPNSIYAFPHVNAEWRTLHVEYLNESDAWEATLNFSSVSRLTPCLEQMRKCQIQKHAWMRKKIRCHSIMKLWINSS